MGDYNCWQLVLNYVTTIRFRRAIRQLTAITTRWDLPDVARRRRPHLEEIPSSARLPFAIASLSSVRTPLAQGCLVVPNQGSPQEAKGTRSPQSLSAASRHQEL